MTCIHDYGRRGVVEIEQLNLHTDVSTDRIRTGIQAAFLPRQGESRVSVVDATTQQIVETQYPTNAFTDMDLTADSRYLFVADYGGEQTGYGTPLRPHYVHRYDLQTRTWKIAQAPKIAWKIEAVSESRVLLQEHDQWVDITLNSFGDSMTELSRISADYYGDMEYDPATGRVYHGGSGSSSREIHVCRIQGDTLVNVGDTGTYGTVQNGGGTSVLSTNGAIFYYGRLQVDAMNIRTNLRTLPDSVYAASARIALRPTATMTPKPARS